ncbi:hypothetical protein BsWGS_18187 [Bradybaena similaris]
MATSKDMQFEGSITGYDDEDVRGGDGRKKKFKPLSAMKKFFTKKKDKKDSVVAVKAKSTTALPSEDDDDDEDDDGGFKAHSKRSGLAANRSLSEDSIFSTELRGQPIAAFPKAALSEESLPKSAFQSELMSKLNKRRTDYLDDDRDDGLPRSPVPAVTTADVILGEPMKKQPGQSGKTSNNRDSDQSLISVDSSENEEEELFLNKWKSSVPARKSASLPAPANKTMDILDFNSIQKTELLVSRAAKHKIKVKPARKANRQSVKHRDTSSPTPLPCLNEESPTSSTHENVKEGWISEKLSPSEEKPSGALTSQASSTVNDKISAQVAADSKSKVSSIAIGSRSNTGTPLTSPTSPLPPAVMSTTEASATVSAAMSAPTVSAVSPTTAVSAPTLSVVLPTAVVSAVPSPAPVETTTTPVSPTARFPPQTDTASDSSLQSLAPSSSSNQQVANAELAAAPTVTEKKTEENLSLSEKGDKTIFMDTHISAKRLSQSQKGAAESKIDTDIKSRMSHFQIPNSVSSKLDAINSSSIDSLQMKVANPELTSVTVLKEEQKVKHQIRSRTLPAVIGEQSSATVQRSSSHRIPNSGAGLKELQDDSAVLSDENRILSSTSLLTSSSLPDAKKPENIKASSTESKIMSAGEPSWMNMVRRKKSEPETHIEIEKIKPNESSVARPGANTTAPKSVAKPGANTATPNTATPNTAAPNTAAPKSVFTSASYLEKKRGSTETISFRNRDLPDVTVKKTDSSDPKRQSLDLSSLNKAASAELSSSKKETVELDLCNVGSVKASRSIFDSSSKPVSQRDNVPTSSAASTHSDRIRKFSSSSSAISGSSSVKASSNTNQELPNVAAVASEVKSTITSEIKSTVASEVKSAVAGEVKPTVASVGSTHSRGSILKTSMSKMYEVKPSIYTRTGSVKGPTLSATSSSPSASTASASTASAPSASAPVKAEAVSALKADSSEAATAAPSSQPSAQHAPAHVTAPPNPSLPSQTSSKVVASEKPAADVKKPVAPAKVPAWRTHLSSKDVKIEIIENSPTPTPASSSQTSSENLRKPNDKAKLQEAPKKTELSSGAALTVETEKTNRRTSKVLDMVKNFQNLQAPS